MGILLAGNGRFGICELIGLNGLYDEKPFRGEDFEIAFWMMFICEWAFRVVSLLHFPITSKMGSVDFSAITCIYVLVLSTFLVFLAPCSFDSTLYQ